MDVQEFSNRFRYELDNTSYDKWRVPVADADGFFIGDCEDYSLGILYYVICKKSWLKFWLYLIIRKAKLCKVDNDGGHIVLRYNGHYIDNWTRKWVSKKDMEALGHRFYWIRYIPYQVAVKMIYTKIRGLF